MLGVRLLSTPVVFNQNRRLSQSTPGTKWQSTDRSSDDTLRPPERRTSLRRLSPKARRAACRGRSARRAAPADVKAERCGRVQRARLWGIADLKGERFGCSLYMVEPVGSVVDILNKLTHFNPVNLEGVFHV